MWYAENQWNIEIKNVLFRFAASCQIHSSNALSATSLEEKLGKPKKPLTPFFRYLSENRVKLHNENPQLKPIEVVKLCAKQYATIDPAQKTKYQDEYIKDQEEYIRKRTVYDNKLTDEQKYEIASAKQEVVEKKARIEYRKVWELLLIWFYWYTSI